eukprot:SAG22_NODE_7776_length_709_cov_1.377049_2_plen_154_part_01
MADDEVEMSEEKLAAIRADADTMFAKIDSYNAGQISYRQLLSWVKNKAKESGIRKIPDEMLVRTNEMFQEYDTAAAGCLNSDQFFECLKGMEKDAMFAEMMASKEKKAAEDAAKAAAAEAARLEAEALEAAEREAARLAAEKQAEEEAREIARA